MKKLLLIGFLLLPMTALATSWKIDDPYTFTLSTNGSSGAVDADSVPSYRVYEDETGTAILTGSMAKLDDAETTGFYSEQITLSSANGLEKGKSYNIIICAAIASVTYCTTEESFQIEAEVDANTVSGTPPDSAGIAGIQADTDNIQTRIPTTTAKSNIDAAYDGTGYSGEGIAIIIDSTNTAMALAMVVDAASAGVITVDNQFVGKSLYCGTRKESRKIVATDNNTTDTITIEPGRPFNSAPGNGADETCYIR